MFSLNLCPIKQPSQLKEEQFCHGRIVNFTLTLDLMLFHGAMLNLLILFVNKRVTSYKRVLWLIIKSTKNNTSGVEGAANSVCLWSEKFPNLQDLFHRSSNLLQTGLA